jgi:hypothetical protein
MKTDNPLNYNINVKLPNEMEVSYINMYEICQGCPEVGKLSIDGNVVGKEVFGGPLLYDNGYIYIPCFKRKWFTSGFYLAKINTSTLEILLISDMYQIIDLIKIENFTIYFYDSLEQNFIQSMPLNN